MNQAITTRLIWKDYFVYRSFWAALLFCTALLLCLIVVSAAWGGPSVLEADIMGLFFIGMPLCYAAGVGATSFSQEHENGTYLFLRGLPVKSYSILASRCLFVVLSTLALAVVILMFWSTLVIAVPSFTRFVQFRNPFQSLGTMCGAMLVLSAQAFLSGTMISMLMKRPLSSLLITGVSLLFLHSFLAVSVFNHVNADASIPIVGSLLSAIGLAFVNAYLAPHWFGERPKSSRLSFLTSRSESASSSSTQKKFGQYRCLIWAHLHSFGWLYALLFAVRVVVTPRFGFGRFDFHDVALVFVSGLAIGVSVFWSERAAGQYRFFTERGIRPATVWFARHLVGVVVLLILMLQRQIFLGDHLNLLILMLQRQIFLGDHLNQISSDAVSTSSIVWTMMATYAIGQFAVCFFDSLLVGGFVAFISSLLVAFWCPALHAFGVPALIGIVPLVVACFVGSYRRIHDWFGERNQYRDFVIPAATALIGVLAITIGTAIYRVYEIPSITADAKKLLVAAPDIPATELSREFQSIVNGLAQPNLHRDREYFDDFDSLIAQQPSWQDLPLAMGSDELDYLSNGSQELPRLLELTSEPSFAIASTMELVDSDFNAVFLLTSKARQLQFAGQLDEASEHYRAALRVAQQMQISRSVFGWLAAIQAEQVVYQNLIWWAGSESQTAERVDEMLQWLAEYHRSVPSLIPPLQRDYYFYEAMLSDPDRAAESLAMDSVFAINLMPWELIRARRLNQYGSAITIEELQAYEKTKRDGGEFEAIQEDEHSQLLDSQSRSLFYSGAHMSPPLQNVDAIVENARRALHWQLSAISYKIENGEYPDSLDALSPAHAKPDFYSGRRFIYMKKPDDVRLVIPLDQAGLNLASYPDSHPILWSPGPGLKWVGGNETPSPERYHKLYEHNQYPMRFDMTEDEENWNLGYTHPLP